MPSYLVQFTATPPSIPGMADMHVRAARSTHVRTGSRALAFPVSPAIHVRSPAWIDGAGDMGRKRERKKKQEKPPQTANGVRERPTGDFRCWTRSAGVPAGSPGLLSPRLLQSLALRPVVGLNESAKKQAKKEVKSTYLARLSACPELASFVFVEIPNVRQVRRRQIRSPSILSM